ncbi:hypothetical protein P8452_28362 [Trifolium repens]|nr:hypothetical protein P8452_28362 [Trifolium repens]
MRDIWFGSYKLWANVARFTKEGGFQNELGGKRHTLDGRNKETEIKRLKHNEAPVRSRKIGWDRTKVGNLSYAEAAGRKADGAVEEDRVWARKGLIGMVKNIDEVPLIQQKILDVGITTVKIIPMGGKKVFIQPLEDEDLWDLVKDAEEFYWFVNIKEWNPKEISSDRSIWIRVYGVPVHAWRENFFKRILECTGEVIVLDDDTLKKRRFDYARVLIRTSALSFINQVEKVKIDEDFFVVRLLEEVSFYPTRIAEKQSLQQVEDEESNSQWWINHNVEEEEEGEMNSQNLEREYCAFNEMWEEGKNDESGGANGKVQEKSLIPASPKKAAHSAIGVRERKENSPSTTQMGPHYATKDNFILDSTGVLFTGVLGPIKRPIREVHEVTGSGSGPASNSFNHHFVLIKTDILTIFQDGFDDPLDYPRELDEMMGRTFAFRIKWQQEWRQGSVIEIKDSRDLVKKIQIAESSKSIPLEIGVESSKSTPVKIVVDSSRSTPLQIADSLALDDIVMELSSTSEHDHNQLTKITPSKRPPVKEHDDEKLPGQLSSNKPAKMKLRNVKLEKAGL